MITDAVQIALIVGISSVTAGVIAAIPPSIIAWKAKVSADEGTKKTDQGNEKIDKIELAIDGRLSEFMAAMKKEVIATAISAEAKGVLKEKNRAETEARIRKEK